MDKYTLLLDLVKKAGEAITTIHPDTEVTDKEGRGNFVTAADKKSEEILIQGIKKYFPEDTILSEETASSLTHEQLLLATHLWVLDPLDGTADFKFERNHCGVSVGYVEKGEVLMGAVYNPFMKEFYSAKKGEGAVRNDKKIHVSQQIDITKATVYTTNAYEPENMTKHLQMLLAIQPSPWIQIKGSAALSLCEVASGQADLCFSTILKPWDNAGAYIILKEAGAAIVDSNNNTPTFLSPHIIAGNQTLVNQFIALQP